MISFPNAKINLGLYVLSKRDDGYHSIETCFYPVPWCDVLEIIPSETLSFSSSGNTIPGTEESNLCLKTFASLKASHNIPSVHIHLHKNIPIGAGLGGGSSDAAFTCKSLNTLFHLNLNQEQQENVVRPLGSDCAFFIQNRAVIAHEKGDVFSDQNCVDLSGYWIYLIHPSIHVSTKDAYNGIQPKANRKPIYSILQQPIETWKNELVNDFETSVFKQFPDIEKVKNKLYSTGAIYAAMSGSGSTVFGLFKEEPATLSFEHLQISQLLVKL
ncbi:4-(cytidine 5'-diphospho)-2-C-methyl-D-erythritol kinase [Cytophaga aurantiaca]|uniref:4-(cytidine 5'-diphospho)-2-C-methyl-D-erythritol kinase n=1 Tax=Cytophaga aurantiaca TaxID=29530 RepID=UPI0003766800|nr:4-(cytidine 5'-diphospho)-2-C-methyl-D-erythritol kinase [Cytophaga aurantiaca]